jgi:hypothetical protein
MLFLPVGETAMTTSTLFPQFLQSRAEFLAPDLADTSVFDFALPDITDTSFPYATLFQKTHNSFIHIRHAHAVPS